MSNAPEHAFTNAQIVLGDEVIHGSVLVRDGVIVDIGAPGNVGEDLDGDYLVPGLVELHTDHLENHYAPRPGVRWNPVAAVQAHDAQVASSGITTVFDALRIGTDEDATMGATDMRRLADAIENGVNTDRLRADHFIHLRCEVSAPDCGTEFEAFENDDRVRLVSLMDHAPGQRQFASIDAYRVYYQGKLKMSNEAFDIFCERRMAQSKANAPANRQAISDICRARGITLASHDDATLAHVAESRQHGVRVAEFPTTMEAAKASHEAGLSVLMGAPNIVRGGSHSGNISAKSLAAEGLLDILSSDYVPFSLMQAAFHIGDEVEGITLPEALALVSRRPAEAMGLTDRGQIATGKRADMVRVRMAEGVPIVRGVWREGRRVA
jgi:alpha-D-ribose 1-methylphosphonate 5-triphosphate diphosphatase